MIKIHFVILLLFFTACAAQAQPTLYGLVQHGGTNGGGTLIKYNSAVNDLSTLLHFESLDSYTPGNLIQAANGKLYGMTRFGGRYGYGTIFSFAPASATYTKVKDFDVATGSFPQGSLIRATDGKLYGMTEQGGATGNGVVFSFDPVTSIYTKLKDFDGTNGARPQGSLMQAINGKLYGMTQLGGSNDLGVLFSFDPTSATFAKITDFDGTNGAKPQGSLIQAVNGKLYGVTYWGGVGKGVLFSFDPVAASYSK